MSSQVNYLYNQNQIGLYDLWKIKYFLFLDPFEWRKTETIDGKNWGKPHILFQCNSCYFHKCKSMWMNLYFLQVLLRFAWGHVVRSREAAGSRVLGKWWQVQSLVSLAHDTDRLACWRGGSMWPWDCKTICWTTRPVCFLEYKGINWDDYCGTGET